MKKRPEYVNTFSQLGSSLHVQDDTLKWLQRFVCHLYGYDSADDVNTIRYTIFKSGKYSEEQLPPTEDVLYLHIKRSNYQAYIWRHCMENSLNMPDPNTHGWYVNDESGDLEIKWMSLPLAPDSILCHVNCSCTKGCSTARCSCKKSSLRCSDLCRCKDCQNSPLEDEEDEEELTEEHYDKDSDESDSDDEEEPDTDEAADESRIVSEWETSVVYTETDTEESELL